MLIDHPTVFFRIGSDKAGTTTLGSFIAANRPIFEKLGYSIFGPNANPLINYIVQENELKELDFFSPKNLAWRDQVELFLKNIDLQRSIFIQTETLWGRLAPRLGKNPSLRERALDLLKALRDQFSGHDIKIILHLRRADGYYESQFGQSVKAGGAKSLQYILDGDGPKNLATGSIMLINLLETVYGKENIIIKPFERVQFVDGDLLLDTLKMLNVYEKKENFRYVRSNDRLHRLLIISLLRLNGECGKILHNKDLIFISDYIADHLGIADNKYYMTTNQREKVVSIFSEFYSYIENNYLDGRQLFIEGFPSDDACNYSFDDDELSLIDQLILGSKGRAVTLDNLNKIASTYKML